MRSNEDIIRARLLYHLRSKNIIEVKHTHFDTLGRGFPKYLVGEAKDVAKKLIKEGWLISKPTSYDLQVSLNKERLTEIDSFIKKILGFNFD